MHPLSPFVFLLAAVASCQSRPSATISAGTVVGVTSTVSSATAAITKYVGVPYASSPPLRFASPVPAPSFTAPYDASTSKPACLQQFTSNLTKEIFNNPGGEYPEESEDCLYLNVYSPPGATVSSGFPVMFWIYGGNLAFGDGSLRSYDGGSFAYNQEVVVVTINYRTNVFGFSNSPEIPTSEQNAGFFDQRLALQWVQDNIAAFGGDKDKVTIFGESAGAYSVKQLVALPPDPVPFRAAILESSGYGAPTDATLSWEHLVEQLNCTTASSQLACVRSKDGYLIRDLIDQSGDGFGPVQDGATRTTDVRGFISNGTSAKVPLMIGTNADEGRVISYALGLDEPGANITAFIQSLFPGNEAIQDAIEAFYPLEQAPYYVASEIITDLAFQCPAASLARYFQNNGGYNVYRYLYNASFPNLSVFPDAGAFHSSEIPSVFGTYDLRNDLGQATPQQIALSSYMQTAWANFAKNPTTTGPGEDWPLLGSSENVQDLGGNGAFGGYTIQASSIDQSCPIYQILIDLEGY